MRRRDFIKGIASSAAACPLATRAQQPIAVVGLLGGASPALFAGPLRAFRGGLAESGAAESRNLTIEERWAEGRNDRLPDLATDLVRRKVDVIVTVTTPGALAAKAATPTIPVVFAIGSDPVKDGIVPSLNRPGGNVTGITALTSELGPKRLELISEIVPQAASFALLVNRRNPNLANSQTAELQTAAGRLKRELYLLDAGTEAELDTAFAQLKTTNAQALIISADGFFTSHSRQLAALAIQHRIPAVYQNRSFAEAGGLVSYGGSTADAWRLAGVYAGRILRGEQPADLPVQQATKVELVLNSKTAKVLGLVVPPSVLARADEVIE
ncbi:ABC transporter substrate-binding protein [Bradyrhizobium sp. AZCC 2289]|uniref:ABC transporter substrate-binding protein n=1 Tax=Bradyrhizobium sp. AZCC 2289 TaxID=3117026 RepID=UPI002FF3FBD5